MIDQESWEIAASKLEKQYKAHGMTQEQINLATLNLQDLHTRWERGEDEGRGEITNSSLLELYASCLEGEMD